MNKSFIQTLKWNSVFGWVRLVYKYISGGLDCRGKFVQIYIGEQEYSSSAFWLADCCAVSPSGDMFGIYFKYKSLGKWRKIYNLETQQSEIL